MSIEILSSLKQDLAGAYRVLETVVIRTTQGTVFTIDIGQSLFAESGSKLSAKITQVVNIPSSHIGICEGGSVDEVLNAAQKLIVETLGAPASRNEPEEEREKLAVPKPHFAPGAGVRT